MADPRMIWRLGGIELTGAGQRTMLVTVTNPDPMRASSAPAAVTVDYGSEGAQLTVRCRYPGNYELPFSVDCIDRQPGTAAAELTVSASSAVEVSGKSVDWEDTFDAAVRRCLLRRLNWNRRELSVDLEELLRPTGPRPNWDQPIVIDALSELRGVIEQGLSDGGDTREGALLAAQTARLLPEGVGLAFADLAVGPLRPIG